LGFAGGGVRAALCGSTRAAGCADLVDSGILLLQQTFGVSDEKVVETWVQNPYWQYFCGEEVFQYGITIDPSLFS